MAIKNGEIADADEVMNAFGSLFNDTAQNIFNADYIGFDSRLKLVGLPPMDNTLYGTFRLDNAVSTNDMTHNSTDDLYEVDTGATSPYIIVGESDDVGEDITNIIPIVNGLFSNGEIINADFETALGSEWVYAEANAGYSGALSTTQKKRGTNSFRFSTNSAGGSGIMSITQSNVDLSNSVRIGLWNWVDGANQSGSTVKIIIDTTTIVTRTIGADDTSFNFLVAEIPDSLRVSGKSVKIEFDASVPSFAIQCYIDDVVTFSADENISISFSNDNSTFTSCTNKNIFRPDTTGQKVLLKIEGPNSDVPGYITEYAIKYNLY